MATMTVAATQDRYLDGLIEGPAWAGTTSFSFPDARSDYEPIYAGAEPSFGLEQLSLAARQVARHALAGESTVEGGNAVLRGMGVAQFTDLDLIDAGFDGADIRLAQSSLPRTAYARMPGNAAGGDIWFGTTQDYRNPVLGDYAYHAILHEIGHALGLKHSQEAGGVANVTLPADRDSIEFTVMSARSAIGGNAAHYTYERWGAPQSFMMLDIAALQAIYGADFSANAGDNFYAWDPLTGAMSIDGAGQGTPGGNRIFLTVWDGGGRDTYDFSAYAGGVSVSLAPGGWSVASTAQLVTLAAGKQARGNIFNALQHQGDERSLIEDAIGGAGHDGIAGNDAANRLHGGAGDDTLSGAGGADTLEAGGGADSMAGGLGDDTYLVDAEGSIVLELPDQGQDTVHAGFSWTLGAHVEALVLTGTVAIDGTGNALANRLAGNDAANHLAGGARHDLLEGWGGADTLDGGAGADTLVGGSGDDTYIVAGVTQSTVEEPDQGIDSVHSSIGWILGDHIEDLTLLGVVGLMGTGNALDNHITGNDGGNRLAGGDGADTLDGGGGADLLAGGEGADTFCFRSATEGADIILDFEAGFDLIGFSASGFGLEQATALILAGRLQINEAGSAVGTLAQFVFSTATTLLHFDDNGEGPGGTTLLADFAGATVTATDFVLIA